MEEIDPISILPRGCIRWSTSSIAAAHVNNAQTQKVVVAEIQ